MNSNLTFILRLQDLLSPGMRAAAAASTTSTTQIGAGMHNVEHSADRAAGGVSRLRTGMGSLMGAVAPLLGIFAGFEFLKSSVEDFDASEQATAQLNATLRSTKGAAGISAEALLAQASALQKTTLYGDETTVGMQSLLLTFTSIKGAIFTEAVPAIQDLATKMGGDLKGATIQVGKALNDPIQGISALSRVGVNFNDSQKATIKTLVETGRMADAQRIILNELGKEFGGSAAAAAAAGVGPFTQIKNKFGDIKEEIGRGVLVIAHAFMPALNGIVTAFEWIVGAVKNAYDWMSRHKALMGAIILVVGSALAVWAAYAAVVQTIIIVTRVWVAIQSILWAIMMANPIVWVIAGIVALIAIIAYVAYATEGWGKQWDQLMKFFRSSWMAFKEYFHGVWLGVQDTFLTGIEQMTMAWYKLKSLWDEDGAAAGLAKIQSQQSQRAAEIAKSKGLLQADLANANAALTWEIKGNGKTLGTITGDIKKRLGINTAPGVTPLSANAMGLGGTEAAAGGGLGDATGAAKSKSDGINAGGQRSIVINIAKQIEKIENHIMGGGKEVADEIEGAVREAMRRVVYSMNGMAS